MFTMVVKGTLSIPVWVVTASKYIPPLRVCSYFFLENKSFESNNKSVADIYLFTETFEP